ncbi:pantoate--beta-alanine ligase [candidate division KSB1 bacterium]|nr:pantoate--beta-alanine ligase [candidate division KSB1 bacterium]
MIVTRISEMQALADKMRTEGKRIGLVPTMGYLHDGHTSLIKIARQKADVVVTSIYVNPTQFGPNEDLDEYPRDLERDKKLAYQSGTNILFVPDDIEMYMSNPQTVVNVKELTAGLCGASRPWHFQGVTTIVGKLFNIVKPHIAVFGQKDAQQAIVIKKMVDDLNFDIDIIIGPIIREHDGLAMSSRNKYLSAEERQDATALYRALQSAEDMINQGERNRQVLIDEMTGIINKAKRARIDYVDIVDAINLKVVHNVERNILIAVAVYIGKTRLIDNKLINI